MGHEELIAFLRAEADTKIKKLWDDTHAEAEKIRTETSARLMHMRNEHKMALDKAAHEIQNSIFFDAQKKARKIRLESEEKLSGKLFSLAVSKLSLLRNKGYEDIFAALVHELHSLQWVEVRVNPDDAGLARSHFPDAEIITDSSIAGGLVVSSKDKKIFVANTFNKRLQRAWEYILPSIMKDIYQEVSHGTHASGK